VIDARNDDNLRKVWDSMKCESVVWLGFYWMEVRKIEIWILNWVWRICFVHKAHRQIEYEYNHRQLSGTDLLTHVDRIAVILYLIILWNLKYYLLAWMKVAEWDVWNILPTLFSQSCVNIWWMMTYWWETKKNHLKVFEWRSEKIAIRFNDGRCFSMTLYIYL